MQLYNTVFYFTFYSFRASAAHMLPPYLQRRANAAAVGSSVRYSVTVDFISALHPVIEMVAVSKGKQSLYSVLQGGLCVKISAASERCGWPGRKRVQRSGTAPHRSSLGAAIRSTFHGWRLGHEYRQLRRYAADAAEIPTLRMRHKYMRIRRKSQNNRAFRQCSVHANSR
jgi:hypothetical protein